MIDLAALVRRTGEALEGLAVGKFPPIPPDENRLGEAQVINVVAFSPVSPIYPDENEGSPKHDEIADDGKKPNDVHSAVGRARVSLHSFGEIGEIGGKPYPATRILSPNRPGSGEIGEKIACSPAGARSGGKLLDLKTARRRGPWWDGPAWDEPELSVGVMAEWRLGLQRLSPSREPCPGFRSGQWLRVYEATLRFLAEHGPSAADLGWSTLDLFGVDPRVGVARVSCCGALLVSGGSPVVGVTAAAIRYRSGLAFRKTAVPDASVAVWDYAWPEAGR